MNSYKHTYYNLLQLLYLLDVYFYDPKMHGPGVAFKFDGKNATGIAIDGSLSTKNKIFVLLHEIGHLFHFKNELITRIHAGTEQQANDTACQILSEINSDLIPEYEEYYKKINKREYIYGKKKKLQRKRTGSTKKVKDRKSTIKKRS